MFENRDLSEYIDAIKKCMVSDENEKIRILDDLHGIGLPVASLHFIYPDSYPIIDMRTVETLYEIGLIGSKSKNLKNYAVLNYSFFNVMLSWCLILATKLTKKHKGHKGVFRKGDTLEKGIILMIILIFYIF
jgi:hypothetical protein